MLAESLRPPLHWLGALPRDAALALPERYLGLVQASEIADIDARIDAAADALGNAVDFDAIPHVAFLSPTGGRGCPEGAGEGRSQHARPLQGTRIAIARDAAFSFLYPANLETLSDLGAEPLFFSPLNDTALPAGTDAIYLPGGYPELHAAQWSANTAMHDALRAHHAGNRPLLAECGGMMALFDALTDIDGQRHRMAGLLPGETTMQKRLAALGMQEVALPEGTLRGHSFHYSKLSTGLTPLAQAVSPRSGGISEGVYRRGRLTASYVHFYFPSNRAAVAACFLAA
jgi:cobyrinic acid a,c-diamide synthase